MEFTTSNRNVKGSLSLFFCAGSNRFHCIVSRDSDRSLVDVTSMSSPIEFDYTGERRVSKFYAVLFFEKPSTFNLTIKINSTMPTLRQKTINSFKPVKIKGNELAQTISSVKREEFVDDRYFHRNMISDLEKMEIFPKNGRNYEPPDETYTHIYHNKRLASVYRDTRVQRLDEQSATTNYRIASAKARKHQTILERRDQIESKHLKHELKELMVRYRQMSAEKSRTLNPWIIFIVGWRL